MTNHPHLRSKNFTPVRMALPSPAPKDAKAVLVFQNLFCHLTDSIIMKKVLMLLELLLLPAACVSAESEHIVAGPYTISFDLGLPHSAYATTLEGPATSESLSGLVSTKYEIKLENKTGIGRRVTITLTKYDIPQAIPTAEEMKMVMDYMFKKDYQNKNVETAIRSIDGVTGAVMSVDRTAYGVDDRYYGAIYYPAVDNGMLMVVMASGYPWDEGTLQLLKTIHVEKRT